MSKRGYQIERERLNPFVHNVSLLYSRYSKISDPVFLPTLLFMKNLKFFLAYNFLETSPTFNEGDEGEGSHYGKKYVCILVDPKFITEFNHIHNLPQLHRFHYRNYSKSLVWKLTVLISLCSNLLLFRNQDLWDHSFIAYTKVSKKLTFLALKYFHADMHTYLRVSGGKKC